MNTNEHDAPTENPQSDDADLGPEPEWLLDEDTASDESIVHSEPGTQPVADQVTQPEPEPTRVEEPQPRQQQQEIVQEPEERINREPIEGHAVAVASAPVAEQFRKPKPWLLWAIPLVLTAIVGGIGWWASNRGLNDLTTWSALRFQHPGLLPARWTMFMWWAVIALIAVFLIYSALPAGRNITRIKRTGPLMAAGLISAGVWLFAVHWRWDEIALVAMVVTLGTSLASYLMVALNPTISRIWQRLFGVLPLSASTAFSALLLVVTWQGYSSQPFGYRGSSILFLVLLVIAAAIFAFFIRDGLISMVFAIWFLGVAQQQWGDDALISFSAIVAVLLTAATAAMGMILAVESHRPSLTAQVSGRKARTSFFRKTENSPSGELPQ